MDVPISAIMAAFFMPILMSPARIGVNGGIITVRGTGFARGLTASIGGTTLSQLRVTAAEIIVSVPARSDGTQSITLSDSTTGASTTMTDALTYGATANDNIILLYSGNSQTPVGTQAAKPVTVRVVAVDGATVPGATVGWTTANSLQLSACGGATSCSVTTDQSGSATTWLTPAALGAATVTATLAPGVYSPAKSVTATVNAIGSSSDIAAVMPNLRISQGATSRSR